MPSSFRRAFAATIPAGIAVWAAYWFRSLVAALSGIRMAMTYAIVPADSTLLHIFRLLAGGGMAASLVLGFAATRGGDVETHQGWMRRAYALGQGAGTQAITQLPIILLFGPLEGTSLALAMGGAWLPTSASPSG